MTPTIPDLDAALPDDEAAARRKAEQAEFELLQASAKAKKIKNREADQRYALRWIVLGVGLICARSASSALVIVLSCMSEA